MNASSYRPRNSGHDYYGRGTYLVTLVVSGREHLLARYTSVDNKREAVVPTQLGETVLQLWQQTPAFQATHGNHCIVHACVYARPFPWSH